MASAEQLAAICGSGLAELHAWGTVAQLATATLTARPQSSGIQPESLVVANPSDWLLFDLRIGHRSQVPWGGPFRAATLGQAGAQLDYVRVGVDVAIDVGYVGSNPEGETFAAALLCRDDGGRIGTLPLTSGMVVPPSGRRVLLDLGDRLEVFELGGSRGLALTNTLLVRADIDEQFTYLDVEVTRPPTPVLISLRTSAATIYGTDERAGVVIFEVSPYIACCKLEGYVPSWWSTVDDAHTNSQVPA